MMPLNCANGLTPHEEVLCHRINRLTIGYHRDTCKISYKELKKMTGMKAISDLIKSLKEKGWIDYEYKRGSANIIKILPIPIESFPEVVIQDEHLEDKVVISDNHSNHLTSSLKSSEVITSRRAKESIKENFKEREFIIFKTAFKKYTPLKKWDEEVAYEIFLKLSDKNRTSLLDALPFQNNLWGKPDCNHKFTPKASNYLLNRCFLDEVIQGSVKGEKAEIKKEIKYKKYIKESEEDAASQEEIMEIIKKAKMSLNGLDK
jgi:hypothetical protein